MKTLLDCLFVALGGAIGSVSRFLLGKLPVKAAGFPVITLGSAVCDCQRGAGHCRRVYGAEMRVKSGCPGTLRPSEQRSG